jgi:hypothetical protein
VLKLLVQMQVQVQVGVHHRRWSELLHRRDDRALYPPISNAEHESRLSPWGLIVGAWGWRQDLATSLLLEIGIRCSIWSDAPCIECTRKNSVCVSHRLLYTLLDLGIEFLKKAMHTFVSISGDGLFKLPLVQTLQPILAWGLKSNLSSIHPCN